MQIEDHMGKPLAALEVFSKSLEYMKEMVLKKISEECEDLVPTVERIHWIVTVPAIWDEFAKQFMRNAAEKVRIGIFFCIFCYRKIGGTCIVKKNLRESLTNQT